MARRLTIMRLTGDPDELLAIKQEKLDPVTREKARQHGAISHAVARTDDGIMMINLWESEQGSDEMRRDPEVDAALRSAGLGPPQVEHYELVQYETA